MVSVLCFLSCLHTIPHHSIHIKFQPKLLHAKEKLLYNLTIL